MWSLSLRCRAICACKSSKFCTIWGLTSLTFSSFSVDRWLSINDISCLSRSISFLYSRIFAWQPSIRSYNMEDSISFMMASIKLTSTFLMHYLTLTISAGLLVPWFTCWLMTWRPVFTNYKLDQLVSLLCKIQALLWWLEGNCLCLMLISFLPLLTLDRLLTAFYIYYKFKLNIKKP